VLLALGYVLFNAASRISVSKEVRPLDSMESKLAEEWTQMSYSLGVEAARVLERGTLRWSFALNHCLYTGMAAEKDSEELSKYHESLRQMEAYSVWNARFADTVACFYMQLCENELRRVRGEGVSRKTRGWMEHIIGEAETPLKVARATHFGDIAVGEHEAYLERLRWTVRSLPRRVR